MDFGRWSLVILHPDAGLAERIARTLRWSVDEDGYPRLASTDPEVPTDADSARVLLWVPDIERQGAHHAIEVIPGCELSRKEPDLGGSDAGPELELHEADTVEGGRWCVDGRYWVDVAFISPRRLELFHEKLRIVASLDLGASGGPDGGSEASKLPGARPPVDTSRSATGH